MQKHRLDRLKMDASAMEMSLFITALAATLARARHDDLYALGQAPALETGSGAWRAVRAVKVVLSGCLASVNETLFYERIGHHSDEAIQLCQKLAIADAEKVLERIMSAGEEPLTLRHGPENPIAILRDVVIPK